MLDKSWTDLEPQAPINGFIDIVRRNASPRMVVAEIGAFCGQTTKEYIDIIKQNNGRLYVVDWFLGNEGAVGYHEYRDDGQPVFNRFIENIKGYEEYITILQGRTDKMIPSIPDNSLDICFIDADHRYAGVKNDIELCIPKMKDGGILCGHDLENFNKVDFTDEELQQDTCGGVHCGVIRAVYETFGTDVASHGDTVWSKIIKRS